MIEIKKGIALSIIVILALSAMIIRINDKNYIPFKTEQKTRSKNLAMPDLTTATDLGDGEYRVYLRENSFAIYYNIFNGVYTLDGESQRGYSLNLTNETFDNNYYYSSTIERLNENYSNHTSNYIRLSGSNSTSFLYLNNDVIKNTKVEKQIGIDNNKIINIVFNNSATYDNFQFKLQVEKGSFATPYTVPNQTLSAYTNYEDNLTEIEKADIGLMGITSLTKLINTVTVTIEYAKSIVTAITNFIDKLKPKDNIIPPRIPGYDIGVK